MRLFFSTYYNKVDSKGRVSVPSAFRNILTNSSECNIIIRQSITKICIEGCSYEKMMNFAEAINRFEMLSEKKDAFATAIFAESKSVNWDADGRIVIPKDLMISSKISDTAVFVGQGDTFEIWNPADFEIHRRNAIDIARNNADELKITNK